MDDDRTRKPQPTRPGERETREAKPADSVRRDAGERKPTPIEQRDWRGSGVCGDRHTD